MQLFNKVTEVQAGEIYLLAFRAEETASRVAGVAFGAKVVPVTDIELPSPALVTDLQEQVTTLNNQIDSWKEVLEAERRTTTELRQLLAGKDAEIGTLKLRIAELEKGVLLTPAAPLLLQQEGAGVRIQLTDSTLSDYEGQPR